jgi:hypothetical protein
MKQGNLAPKYQFTYTLLHGNSYNERMDEIQNKSEWIDIAKNQLQSI